MTRSRTALSSVSEEAFLDVLGPYRLALEELVSAVLAAIAGGKIPGRSSGANYSIRPGAMPNLSDGWLSHSGPLDYPSVLDPPYGDEAAKALGRYPPDRFPAFAALLAFASSLPTFGETAPDLARVWIRLQLEAAVDAHITCNDMAAVTDDTARSVLAPLVRGMLEAQLDLAVIAPIALTHFDFNAVRIAPDALIMRMSPELQKARWSGKAYGAKGHDAVVAAATHAIVLTRWTIPNTGYLRLSQSLSSQWDNSTEALDQVFAAFRLVTGIETGYAQELRLARGWRGCGRSDLPQVFAAPARRYPEAFDDYAWNRTDLPHVTRDQMKAVGAMLASMDAITNTGLAIALRRLNTATNRGDPVDAILDAAIALEVLLGDKDGQSISWKLRMRAAALAGIAGGRAEVQAMYDDVHTLYKERSSIVHGLPRKANAPTPDEVRRLAIKVLRRVLELLVRHPVYLDPLRIDAELLLTAVGDAVLPDDIENGDAPAS